MEKEEEEEEKQIGTQKKIPGPSSTSHPPIPYPPKHRQQIITSRILLLSPSPFPPPFHANHPKTLPEIPTTNPKPPPTNKNKHTKNHKPTYKTTVAVPTNNNLAFSPPAPFLPGWVFVSLAAGSESGTSLLGARSRVGAWGWEGSRVRCFIVVVVVIDEDN